VAEWLNCQFIKKIEIIISYLQISEYCIFHSKSGLRKLKIGSITLIVLIVYHYSDFNDRGMTIIIVISMRIRDVNNNISSSMMKFLLDAWKKSDDLWMIFSFKCNE